jgi:hypothetical protein
MRCKFCGKENSDLETEYLKEFLFKNIEIINDCWLWTGTSIGNNGYGIASHEGRRWVASRLSYRIFKGEIPEGLLVCHTCDNRKCINPDHLWIGTHKDNAKDAMKKGRLTKVWGRKKTQEEIDKIQRNRKKPDQKGEKHGQSKLTNEKVLEIREKLKSKITYRELAEEFEVDICTISDIKFRRTWKHI